MPKRSQSLVYRIGDYWHQNFTIKLASGGVRRYRGSLGTSDRAEAERKAQVNRRAAEREQELLALENSGVIPKRETRQDTSLAQALDRYMREVGDGASSVESMRSYNKRLLAHFGPTRALSSIDSNAVLGFREYLGTLRYGDQNPKPLSARTKNAHMNHLRFVLSRARTLWNCKVEAIKWGGDMGVLLRQPKPQQIIQTSGVDFPTLMAALPDDLLPIFGFSLVSAVRQRDALGLKKSQVHWSLGHILVMQKSKTPGGEPHHVPITPEIEKLLRACWDHHPEYVFTYICRRSRHENEGTPLDRGQRYPWNKEQLRERWKEVRKKLGLPDLNWHRIRASAATYYLSKGLPEVQVMAITGHKDIRSFRLYVASLGLIGQLAPAMAANPILADLSNLRQSAQQSPMAVPFAPAAPSAKPSISQ
jgi:integrase